MAIVLRVLRVLRVLILYWSVCAFCLLVQGESSHTC
jgi:hypothetical protein